MKKMIKRADGSYSKRGLWDNIRANKGSGKKPTEEMLEQERKIKTATKKSGSKKSNWLEESKELKFGGPTKSQTAGFDEKQAKRDAAAKELGMVKNPATGKWENPPRTTSSQPSGSSSFLDTAAAMFTKPAPVKTRTEEGGIRRKTGGKRRMGGKKC